MPSHYDDLASFLAVAEELNFTRAAARLNVSPSALSQTIRKLESRLGLRLLVRSTRTVSLTSSGERLRVAVDEGLGLIKREIADLSAQSDAPSGLLRITASEYAALRVLEPATRGLLSAYPGISLEIDIDNGLTDIVAHKFDAGIRVGESVEQNMISLCVAPEMPVRIVCAPSYLARCGQPEHPTDLKGHACINMRFAGSGELFAWEFIDGQRSFRLRVPSRLIVSDAQVALNAALSGTGLAYMPQDLAKDALAEGSLVSVLNGWTAPLPELHLFYPYRTHQTRAFALFVQHMRGWSKGDRQA